MFTTGDIWKQILIHLGQIISLLDTQSLNKIHCHKDELVLLQFI